MTWVLLAPNGEVIASGSWQAVVEAGEMDGLIRLKPKRGYIIARGYIMAPRGMFPEVEEYAAYG